MTAEELKSALTTENIRTLIKILGGTIYTENDDYMICDTFCHCGTSHKLYYYKSSKSFYCYTECGSLDIIEIVKRLKKYNLPEAIIWISNQCHIDERRGFNNEFISDWSFIKDYDKSKSKQVNIKDLDSYDSKILNVFQDKYYQGWIDEGISVESMQKYNIKYSPYLRQIIIPHYDITNRLVGIRGRMMTVEDEERFGKYSPIKIGDVIYKHCLSYNFYGINQNLKTIKNKHKVMLVEAEKSVLQADTMFGDDNFTLAVCGSSFHSYQRDMLIMLGVKEVIIALDKQYETTDSQEAKDWQNHILKQFVKPLSPYFSVYVIWDNENLLNYKQSPTDNGKETLLKLMKNKVYIPSDG